MPPLADVGVVVVTHNSAAVVTDLLASLPPALGPLTAEVVVVDNGSSDDTVDLLRGRPGVQVVETDNNGYSSGINLGVGHLSPDVPVLVLNPDVRLAPGSVAVLLDRLAQPHVGIVAPRITDLDGTLKFSLRRAPTLLRSIGLAFTGHPWLSESVKDPSAYDHPHTVSWATGAALLVSRQCHEELGGWDERFFLYSEETDLSLRARDRGWLTVYEPGATAEHVGSASGWNSRLYAMQILNRVRLFSSRHSAPSAWLYYVVSVARELSLVVRGHAEAREGLRVLVRPSRRPPELRCPPGILPR